jgi:hypothetical protein
VVLRDRPKHKILMFSRDIFAMLMCHEKGLFCQQHLFYFSAIGNQIDEKIKKNIAID